MTDMDRYSVMNDLLMGYNQGTVKLGDLCKRIEKLVDGLEEADLDRKENLRREWWTLEQVNAVALDRKETTLNAESQRLVLEAVSSLLTMLQTHT